MKTYQNILCALDLCSAEYCIAGFERAVELAQYYDAQLTVLHIVEDYPAHRSNVRVALEDLDPEVRKQQACKTLAELAQEFDYDKVTQVVRVSSRAAKHAILRYAKNHQTDLIVVVSHGRHGITSILGSTSSGVSHNAPCDVLVISARNIMDV